MKWYFPILFFILNNSCYSQGESPITIAIDEKLYLKTARDTIGGILSQQKRLKLPDQVKAAYIGNRPLNRVHVGNHYSIDELNLISIPVFRIMRLAFHDYDCDKNFEPFICFNERLKYQHTFILDGKKYLGSVNIPNIEYEYDRIYSGMDYTWGFEKNHYAESLFFYEGIESETFTIVQQNPDNFFFKLFGMEEFLFDVENGKIYARYIGQYGGVSYPGQTDEEAKTSRENLINRLPLNEYIKKNDLADRIKETALGFYTKDWENPQLKTSKKCTEYPQGSVIIINKAVR